MAGKANQKAAETQTPERHRGRSWVSGLENWSQAVAKVTSDWESSCPSVASGIALLLGVQLTHADATNYVQEMQRCSFPGDRVGEPGLGLARPDVKVMQGIRVKGRG